MNRVAIGYLTKDRTELSRQTVQALLQPEKFDLFWFDGSSAPDGRSLPEEFNADIYHEVRGGPDAAVAYALTTMLAARPNRVGPGIAMSQAAMMEAERGYDYIGLCENDVLLDPNWFAPTFQLFERGRDEGLEVGAVSARCFADRILCQRDGFALMHNLGWGQQIMTRQAAELALHHMRTGFTTENRRIFMQLSGLDIGRWFAFGVSEHMVCADWHNDAMLAAHGLASLALCPSPVQMIGQVPPLAEQGLTLADKPIELLRNDDAFTTFAARTAMIRNNEMVLPHPYGQAEPNGPATYFAHQIGAVGGRTDGAWRLRWFQGLGPFGWEAGSIAATITIPASGPCGILVSGGKAGGEVKVEDMASGYVCDPMLQRDQNDAPVMMQLTCPAGVAYRDIQLTALTPGVVFHGVKFQEPQPVRPGFRFDHNVLPPA